MSAPTTFEAHGHCWQIHTPGYPMPVGPKALVSVLFRCMESSNEVEAHEVDWGKFPHCDHVEIIGWRDDSSTPTTTPPQEKDEQSKAGTPLARLAHLLDELQRRFPDANNELSSRPPEPDFIAAIDAQCDQLTRLREENASMRTAINASKEALELVMNASTGAKCWFAARDAIELLQPFTTEKK